MKYSRVVPFISFISAVVVSVAAICVIGAPAPTVEKVIRISPETYAVNTATADLRQMPRVISVTETEPEKQPEPDMTAIQRVLDSNRVFDGFVLDTDALVDEAQIVLLDQCEQSEGQTVIRRDTVDRFISQLYGRTVEHDDDDLYYKVAPRGFDSLSQRVVSVERCDGGLNVTSTLTVGDSDTEYTVLTVLSPAQTDFGYIIRSADIM